MQSRVIPHHLQCSHSKCLTSALLYCRVNTAGKFSRADRHEVTPYSEILPYGDRGSLCCTTDCCTVRMSARTGRHRLVPGFGSKLLDDIARLIHVFPLPCTLMTITNNHPWKISTRPRAVRRCCTVCTTSIQNRPCFGGDCRPAAECVKPNGYHKPMTTNSSITLSHLVSE